MEIVRPYLEDDKENFILLYKSFNLIRESNNSILDIDRKFFSSNDFISIFHYNNK